MGLGTKTIRFEKLDSTSRLARELAEDGEPEGTVVAADEQTEGTGRLHRKWVSPKGGLWFSLVLRPPVPAPEAPKLTLLAGVAVAAAMRSLYRLDAHLKWPNDVLLDGKKLAGILSEARLGGDGKVDFVILGIGINANFPLSEFPEELQKTATTLREALGRKADMVALMRSVLSELEGRYKQFCGGDTAATVEEWKLLTCTFGNRVRVETSHGIVTGVAVDIDESGALVVRTDEGSVTVPAGDVVHLG
jgi:BirA family biotin operon repressor/biotin-[acetyl-CoA-carboxylase] ligase